MITVDRFLASVKENARRVKTYRLGCSGSGGECDCVGLIIGALRLAGVSYKGTHGSNYFARYYTVSLHAVSSAADLEPGMLVYKAHNPGDSGYDAAIIEARYQKSGDLRDYYHIGVVQSVKPLIIAHCSMGGMHYDSTIGKWRFAGYCKGVDYMSEPIVNPVVAGKTAVVDTPNDGTLNVRAKPSLNGKILTRISEGDHVEVSDVRGEWALVRAEIGWVQTKFLRSGE